MFDSSNELRLMQTRGYYPQGLALRVQGHVSRKYRNFSGLFRVSQFQVFSHQTPQLFRFMMFEKNLKDHSEQADGSFVNGFSGPKRCRDFPETGHTIVEHPSFAKMISTYEHVFLRCV